MISKQEILKGFDETKLTDAQRIFFSQLFIKMNQFRQRYGKSMVVTSGFRSKEDHIRVYKELAEKRKIKFDESKIPWGSAHLKCAAVDVSDSDGELMKFCQENELVLIEIGLWCEVPDDQPRVHFQVYPPASQNRFFHP